MYRTALRALFSTEAHPLFGLIGLVAGQGKSPFAGIFGVVFAILMPVLYGAMGFVSGAIGGLLYNLLARWVGGFELEMDVRPQTLTAPYPIVPLTSPPANS